MNTDNVSMNIISDMKIGDWITLAAVIVAVVFGVLSIIQTQRLRRAEIQERLLNEIIAWAEAVRGWGTDEKADAKLREAKNPWIIIWLELARRVSYFSDIKRKGQIVIRPIAMSLGRKSFIGSVDNLITGLQTHMELIGLQQIAIDLKAETFPPEFNSAEDKVITHLASLYAASDMVIEEATKIKTKI